MNLQTLIEQYGYLAIFIGTLLEGETVLLLGGFAAHRGYLELPWVIAIATAGGFLGDQILFFLGRRHGAHILARFPSWQDRAKRVHALFQRFHAPLIVLVRFLYGLRIVGPIVIGSSGVPPARFFIYNLIGAVIWALLFGVLGFVFGHAVTLALADIQNYEEIVLGAIALISIALWGYFRKRKNGENCGG